MTTPPFERQSQPGSNTGKRILIGIGGVVLLALGAVITLGAELVGCAAIVVAWFVMRRRKRRLTRVKAWLVSVVATAIPLIVIFAASVIAAPKVPEDQQRKNIAAARARTRDSMPEWLKKLTPAQQQTSPAADSIAQKLLENKGFMVWIVAMGALLGSAMVALFAGTIGWGATMILFRAVTDEWMGAMADAPPVNGEA